MGLLGKAGHLVRTRASRLAYNSVLYGLSLGGSVPSKLLFSPVDLWAGDAEAGRALIHNGSFAIDGDRLELHNADWSPEGVGPAWIEHIHGFEWLRDLRALGGDQGRLAARMMIENWIESHAGWHEIYWRPDILGRRVASWLGAYDFFGESADAAFQELFFTALIRQVRHLSRALPGQMAGVPLLNAIKGLAYAGLTLEGRESCLAQALEKLHAEIDRQILTDGGHISRSPQQLADAIRVLIDIRTALRQGGYPCPEVIQHALDRAVPALRFFRHADRKFALFNGCQEGDEDVMKSILIHAGARGKALNSLPHTGYERMALGKALLIADCGRPAPWPHDSRAHAAPLAFEFSYGRERVFVNCGTHPTDSDWQDALRATPAHNALTMDDRNVCEIVADGSLGRKPKTVIVTREDKEHACLVDACHDGYGPLSGITHRRRFYLATQGHDLRGEDNLTCSIGLSRPHDIAVRFHLHPDVRVSLVQDGREALLRLNGGAGWRFSCTGASLALENSVYLGEGIRPRKTKQIVLSATMDSDTLQIKWALQRE